MLAVVASIALFGTWMIDDAGIVWSYARNIASGRGSVAYAGGPVGEGFSDPLWMFMLAGLESVGLRADLGSKALGLVFGGLGVALVPFLARSENNEDRLLVSMALATHAGWAMWAASGLETALFGALLVATTVAARAEHPSLAGLLAALACVTRPEGPLLAVGALIAGRAPMRTLLAPAFAVLAWHGVRWQIFGLLWPLPAYAKLHPDLPHALAGLWYVFGSFAPVGALVAVGAVVTPADRRRELALDLAPLGAVVVFCALSGGDWMRHGRFVVPVVPFVIAAFLPQVRAWAGGGVSGAAMVALVLVPQLAEGWLAVQAPPLPIQVQARQGDVLRRIGRSACGDSFPLVASPDIGGLLWVHPELRVVDLGGLTEPELVGVDPLEYWPERLSERPMHALYLHGDWPERTGLDDATMRHAGYLRVCRRGAHARSPTMWVHRRCDLGLVGSDLEVVEAWCRDGAR